VKPQRAGVINQGLAAVELCIMKGVQVGLLPQSSGTREIPAGGPRQVEHPLNLAW